MAGSLRVPLAVLRSRLALALPALFTLGWLIYVEGSDQWERVAAVWPTSTTMIFGSFVAGSTPQGGGAVAFPVFTKMLEITGPVARTFALSIQATGMVMASATILLSGRRVETRAIVLGSVGGLIGFLFGAFVLSDPSAPWWVPRIPGAWIKVGFTIAIAAMAFIIRDCFAGGSSGHDAMPEWTKRSMGALLGFATMGGVASSLVGSGADVLLFIFLVAVMGLHPRVGIPTSIITMAIVSVAGLVLFGLLDGQLSSTLGSDGRVVAIAGEPLDVSLDPTQFDLFGIWLGAAPIVVWGAPLGAWVASVLPERRLIAFVALMAVAEVLSTIVFLDSLRTDRALAAFGVLGLAGAFVVVQLLGRARSWIVAPENVQTG